MSDLTPRELIYAFISEEREYQEKVHPPIADNPYSLERWIDIMYDELMEAKDSLLTGRPNPETLSEILQVATVAVACLEQHGVVSRKTLGFTEPTKLFDRSDMLGELSKGKTPLEVTIMKWESLVDALSCDVQFFIGKGLLLGSAGNCALCYVHNNFVCDDCPVSEHTGRPLCLDTPYKQFAGAISKGDDEGIIRYAKEELEFLRSLRPKNGDEDVS